MRIHRYQGRDLQEALGRALAAHGADAVVLAQERLPDGRTSISVGGRAGPEMLRALGGGAVASEQRRDGGVTDLRRRLAARGGSAELADEVAAKVEASGARGVHALDAAARALGELLPLAPSPKAVGCQALCLLGPCGAGKTTTAAKLALRLARAGRKVLLASIPGREDALGSDSRGVAARLGLPHVVAGRPAELLASARARRGLDAVLIDAPGCGARERARIEALGTFLDAVAAELPLERYLLVPATLAAAPARAVTEAYAVLAPTAIVVTKLDESTAPAAALEAARAANLPLALLCDGAALAQHLRRPKPDDLADLLLRGRLA